MFFVCLHILTKFHLAVNVEVQLAVEYDFRWALRFGDATLQGEHLAPDYARCDSLVSDQMKHRDFIHANKAQFGCTLGTKQPPRSARLNRKKNESRSRLTSTKLKEANEKLGAMDWKVLSADALLDYKLRTRLYIPFLLLL